MAEEAFMLFIGITLDDGFFDLAADFTDGAYGSSFVDLSSDFYGGICADGGWTLDYSVGHNFHTISQIDGTLRGIEDYSGHDVNFTVGENTMIRYDIDAGEFFRFDFADIVHQLEVAGDLNDSVGYQIPGVFKDWGFNLSFKQSAQSFLKFQEVKQ